MEKKQVKFKGVPVYMDGEIWIVPSLSVRQFRDNFDKLQKGFGSLTPENISEKVDETMPVILMALNRNYPDLTPDRLIDMLDMSTLPEVFQAIAAASGTKRIASTEGAAGESEPVAAIN
jgi:hypothetical protein